MAGSAEWVAGSAIKLGICWRNFGRNFRRQFGGSKKILENISSTKCFIAGGGKTYSRFYHFLTDLFITPHPYVFGSGVPLFSDEIKESRLKFNNLVEVSKKNGIFQYQYKIHKK